MERPGAIEKWWLQAWPHRLAVRKYIALLMKTVPHPFRGEVLEVGAGYGLSSRLLLEKFPQVELTATDVDPCATATFAKLSQQYGQRLKVCEADIMNLPFDRDSFDFVIAVHVLRYLDDVPAAVRQCLRVSRPGALIGIADQPRRELKGRQFNREELERIVTDQGGELVASRGKSRFVIWARNPFPAKIEAEMLP